MFISHDCYQGLPFVLFVYDTVLEIFDVQKCLHHMKLVTACVAEGGDILP